MKRLTTKDCDYCIDGFMPNGISPSMGPVYTTCKLCESLAAIPTCTGCGGQSSFPAAFTCLHCLGEHLATLGLAAVMCARCGGITELIPLDAIPPEMTP